MSAAGLPAGTQLNNGDLGSSIIIASWTLTTFSALFLFARVFAKLWTRRGLWVDDYILIVAWFAVLAPAIMSTVAVHEGLGKHIYNVPAENIPPLSILINSIVTVLVLASALSKTSFVITVLRLVTGYMRWAAWTILVTTNIFFGINIILLWVIFDPNPPAPSATPAAPPTSNSSGGTLTPLSTYGLFTTAYSAAMDFALVGMAWIVVSRLRVRTRREKFGVGLAMSMGTIAGVTSIIKATVFPTLSNGDITFTSASLHIWSLAEPSVTIIAASIPLLRIIFVHVRQLTTQKSGTHSQPGYGNMSGSGPSIGGGDRRRKGLGSVSFANNGGAQYGIPYANSFENSEESVMLQNLQAVPHLQSGDRQLHKVEDVEGVEPARPSSVLGSDRRFRR